jgi:hypothetical protein
MNKKIIEKIMFGTHSKEQEHCEMEFHCCGKFCSFAILASIF